MIVISSHLPSALLVSDETANCEAAAVEILSNSQYTPLRQLNCRWS